MTTTTLGTCERCGRTDVARRADGTLAAHKRPAGFGPCLPLTAPAPGPTKTLTLKSYRHNREERLEDSNSTVVTIAIAPPRGERFSRTGLEQAARAAEIAAFELATAYLRALPAGCHACLPSVAGGDTWAERATAIVTIEHDGNATAIATLKQVVAQASK